MAQAGTQAMNSYLSLVINPFGRDTQPFLLDMPRRPRITKGALAETSALPEPRRWSIWGAGYGGQSNVRGNTETGSHDRGVNVYGFATGLDYRVTSDIIAGFAVGGGGTRFALGDGLGGGHSEMAQAAVYASTRIDAAYISGALAYAWHQVTVDRNISLFDLDHLTGTYAANNIGGRLEGGYRFPLAYAFFPGRYGVTPYGAVQAQSFLTPAYGERNLYGASVFGLDYQARAITTTRTELGAWFDWSRIVDDDKALFLRARAAWANDHWSSPSSNAVFQNLPGAGFTVIGAAPPRDLALVTARAEVGFKNGLSVAIQFDAEFSGRSERYFGSGQLRYVW